MKFPRRQFLHLAGAATALIASPYVVRAHAQAPKIGEAPKRSARDRLEEALARIADPKGEGARACLTIYSEVARDAANAADARARAGITLGPLDGAMPEKANSTMLVFATITAPDARSRRTTGASVGAGGASTSDRHRYRRLNPHSRRALWRGRIQAEQTAVAD